MKIIELLNKIAKKTQPDIIKYDNQIFEWSKVGMFGGNYYKEYDFTPLNIYTNLSAPEILNSKIEVIK